MNPRNIIFDYALCNKIVSILYILHDYPQIFAEVPLQRKTRTLNIKDTDTELRYQYVYVYHYIIQPNF